MVSNEARCLLSWTWNTLKSRWWRQAVTPVWALVLVQTCFSGRKLRQEDEGMPGAYELQQ